MEKISGGSAKAGQLMQLFFFAPFTVLLLYITILNFSIGILFFLFFCIGIIALIFYNGYDYADLYLCDDFLIIKKIFITKKIHINDIIEINRALLPFTYYIRFNNNYMVYFTSKYSDIPKLFLSLDSEKGLNRIKSILLKNENPDPDKLK